MILGTGGGCLGYVGLMVGIFYFYLSIGSLLGKQFSDSFSIQNGLKQGNVLSPLLLNFALENTIRKLEGNQVGLKLNKTTDSGLR
jgi:hypothetical protein